MSLMILKFKYHQMAEVLAKTLLLFSQIKSELPGKIKSLNKTQL